MEKKLIFNEKTGKIEERKVSCISWLKQRQENFISDIVRKLKHIQGT